MSLACNLDGYPLHRENRENDKNNSLSGKTQGIWKFCQTQGILFAQVVDFLVLKIKSLTIFAAKISFFFSEAGYVSFVSIIVTKCINRHRGNIWSDRKRNRKNTK